MKFQPIDQGDDDDEADADLDWDAMAAKIAADGGSVVLPDDIKQKMLKRSKRQGDGDDKTAPAGDTPSVAPVVEAVRRIFDSNGAPFRDCLKAATSLSHPAAAKDIANLVSSLCRRG